MIPFYPKFADAEDAPDYRVAESRDKCGNCAHFRDIGSGRGHCEKFSFMCQEDYVCDDYRPSGAVKQSSSPLIVDAYPKNIKGTASDKIDAAVGAAKRGTVGDIPGTLRHVEKVYVPERYKNTVKALKIMFPEKKASTRERIESFTSALDPLAGGIAKGAIRDDLSPSITEDEIKARRRLAALGGGIGGGVLVPGGVSAAIGAAHGALGNRGFSRISGAARGAGSAVSDTFSRAGAPGLVAGAGLGALGALSQYDLGRGLSYLAKEGSLSVRDRLRRFRGK